MAFLDQTFYVLGDLVQHEHEPSIGYARKVISLNFVASQAVPLGTVVASTDAGVSYHLVVAADLTATGVKFAVVFGDRFSFRSTWNIVAATATPAVAFVRGGVILSDFLLKANNTQLTSGNITTLRGLLEAQGVLVETAY